MARFAAPVVAPLPASPPNERGWATPTGGTQSEEGGASKMALASRFGTWRAQGRNP